MRRLSTILLGLSGVCLSIGLGTQNPWWAIAAVAVLVVAAVRGAIEEARITAVEDADREQVRRILDRLDERNTDEP